MRISKVQARELGQALIDAADSEYNQMQIVYIDYTHIVAVPTLNREHVVGGGLIVEYTTGIDDMVDDPPPDSKVIPLFG